MIPAIGLVLIGKPRSVVPLPLPVFLVWPVMLVALAGVTLAARLVDGRDRDSALTVARCGLLACCQLSGLRVDVRSSDGTRVLIWLF